jgi:alpha-amylase/alpha-mannosidase (GH57 family)
MDAGRKVELVFLWHMHQPDYRDHATGEFRRPWTYLHALKDYTDMAGHLERHPQVRAVVNFVPVLLDQIEDYVRQFDAGDYRDPLLRLLARESLDRLEADERRLVLSTCFPGNHARMVAPYPRFERLRNLHRQLEEQGESATAYLSGAFFADVLVWYHLVWTGETERRSRALLAELMTKGECFTLDDRRRLLSLMGDTLRALIPRYRALAERGQVELSATPDTHPLAPLLLDFASAREAQPDLALPQARCPPPSCSSWQPRAAAGRHRARACCPTACGAGTSMRRGILSTSPGGSRPRPASPSSSATRSCPT